MTFGDRHGIARSCLFDLGERLLRAGREGGASEAPLDRGYAIQKVTSVSLRSNHFDRLRSEVPWD